MKLLRNHCQKRPLFTDFFDEIPFTIALTIDFDAIRKNLLIFP